MSLPVVHPDLTVLTGQVAADSIVSRTLVNEGGLRCVLFDFAAGQELTEHTNPMAATVQVLAGTGTMTLGDQEHGLQAGTWVYIPPHLPHSVRAQERLVFLLTLARTTP